MWSGASRCTRTSIQMVMNTWIAICTSTAATRPFQHDE